MTSWFAKFLTSSIGKKVIMSLTGLFLISFLLVHLMGNLQLILAPDGGRSFNEYAYFMTHNPVIKTLSYGLYLFIIIHAVQGLALAYYNRKARGNQRYAVKVDRTAGASKSAIWMGSLGTVILIFIVIHMAQFWLQMKLDKVAMVTYDSEPVRDLYTLVATVYQNIGFVIFYVVAMAFIAFHLWHGFQSAFQTLGLNHKKYTPLIKAVGYVFSVLIPFGFAVIPVIMFLRQQ